MLDQDKFWENFLGEAGIKALNFKGIVTHAEKYLKYTKVNLEKFIMIIARNTAAHELGHILGFEPCNDVGCIMDDIQKRPPIRRNGLEWEYILNPILCENHQHQGKQLRAKDGTNVDDAFMDLIKVLLKQSGESI